MSATKSPDHRWQMRLTFATLFATCAGAVLLIGCSDSSKNAGGRTKIKVAYLGLTCEAPLFSAYENGYFQEEGLDVELVKTDWDGLREGLGMGQFDANHTLVMYVLKPIESGTDIKITAGVHLGCLRVQVAAQSDLKSPVDLKGKRIGVPTHLGSPPYLFASRVLAANNVDPRPEAKQVEWLPFPPAELGKALQDGRVDAVATADPIGTILLGKGIVKTIADQALDAPYKDEYCCAVVVSGKLARENPAAAAKTTRAILKGSKWVNENPTAAAKMAVDKQYVASTVEINSQALSKLNYMPGIERCKRNILEAATEMKQAGLLKPTTEPEELAKRAWVDLDGVTDAWIKDLKVEKVANGGRPRMLDAKGFAALFGDRKGAIEACCILE
jgi:sulfonate transport system substrate-binding protein